MSTELAASEIRREPLRRFRAGGVGRGAGSSAGCSGRRWSSRSPSGRLRDVDWPFGLRALVAAGYGMFALAGFVVILSAACGATAP